MEQSRRAVSIAHGLGIKTSGHFVLGLPGETGRSMNDTLKLALDLPLDIAQFYTAAPFPGTRLYDLTSKKGWLKPDSFFSQGHAAIDLPGLPGHRVDSFRRYAYRKFLWSSWDRVKHPCHDRIECDPEYSCQYETVPPLGKHRPGSEVAISGERPEKILQRDGSEDSGSAHKKRLRTTFFVGLGMFLFVFLCLASAPQDLFITELSLIR